MVEFYTSSKFKRPVRLSERTREFAWESLNHKYGKDTRKTPYVTLDHIEGYEQLSRWKKYDAAIEEIVKKAPIRICEGELLSGAATLGDAISHSLPARFGDNGANYFSGLSHLTVDFAEVLAIGMNGIRQKAKRSLDRQTDAGRREFLESCIHSINAMELWHGRYLAALGQREGYEENIRNLKKVPFEPAETFYEAVQSIWFCFAFMRLCGCWPGIGRIDVLLGDYLKKDLADGTVTMDLAREILAHFFIKGCEWIDGQETWGGDAQHYQNIVLSGMDESGEDVTNEVSELVLEIVEETGISDFPITVRVSERTKESFLRRVSEVIRYGGGVVAIYNEDLIIRSFLDMGYSLEEARRFANDGCWEVQVPGKTNFVYIPFDGLQLLQQWTLKDYDGTVEFPDFESLLAQYEKDLHRQVEGIYESGVLARLKENHTEFKEDWCDSVISLFEHDCIERGLSYREGGPVYHVVSPHIGGLPDVANSLYAIKKAVYDDKLVTLAEFMQILRDNWENAEELRKKIQNNYVYFGNDNDEVDLIAAKILNDFSDMCEEYDRKTPFRFVSGVSTFGRQIEWAPYRVATPFGRKKGEVLSGNLSPTPGTNRCGAAAVIKSYCKADLRKQHSGAALDIGFIPSNLDSENAIIAIGGLIKGFLKLGGFFMQIDTEDAQTLIDAQKHPENYQNLSVRVSGWNARFVTMNRQWQDMIIDRTRGE